MPTLTLGLSSHLAFVHEDGGGWIPSGTPAAPPSGNTYQWAYGNTGTAGDPTNGPNYGVGGLRFDLDALIGVPYGIDSIAYQITGTFTRSVDTHGNISTAPDICVDTASIASNDPADIYGAVTGNLLRIAVPSGATASINQSGSVGSLSGVTGLRAGFDSATTPGILESIGSSITGEGVTFDGSLYLVITWHYVCPPPPTYYAPTPCDDPYVIDCMLAEQLDDSMVITPFVDVASIMATDQRAVLWFDTCPLQQEFTSINDIYLSLAIDYLQREPCNPYFSAYYADPYDPNHELQPSVDNLDGSYYYEGTPLQAIPSTAMWAIGRDFMIETTPDEEWSGPATVIFKLPMVSTISKWRATGIVFVGNFASGGGRMDVTIASQLLVCGVKKDPGTGGNGGDPGNPDGPPGPPSDGGGDGGDSGDDGGDTPTDPPKKPGDDSKNKHRGELPKPTQEFATPYVRPTPEQYDVMRRFLARLKRNG